MTSAVPDNQLAATLLNNVEKLASKQFIYLNNVSTCLELLEKFMTPVSGQGVMQRQSSVQYPEPMYERNGAGK